MSARASDPPRSKEHSPFFFISPDQITESEISLRGEDAHHLAVVRRAKQGDVITVSDGDGRIARLSLKSVVPELVLGEKLEERRVERPQSRLCVFQGLAKAGKVDFTIQKLVEIGVDEVVVFLSGRSVQRWDEVKAKKANQRWSAIALEASKQSRRAFLPEFAGPLDLDAAAQLLADRGLVLVAHEKANLGLAEALRARDSTRLAFVVGPEGGLEEGEVELLAKGGKAVRLGAQILRTETAGVVGAAILLFELGRIG